MLYLWYKCGSLALTRIDKRSIRNSTMANGTLDLQTKARRVKQLVLQKAIEVLELGPKDNPPYWTTYETILKNAVPRSQEITGADGKDLIPQPILSVPTNVSNSQNSSDVQENPGSTGRDVSEQDDFNFTGTHSAGAVGQDPLSDLRS